MAWRGHESSRLPVKRWLLTTRPLTWLLALAGGCEADRNPREASSFTQRENLPAPQPSFDYQDLFTDRTLSTGVRELLREPLSYWAANADAAGTYSPVVAFDGDHRSTGDDFSFEITDGSVHGSLIVANPAPVPFSASVLCIRGFVEQIPCTPDADIWRFSLTRQTASVVPVELPAVEGDLLSFAFLIDNDQADGLPNSLVTTWAAGATLDAAMTNYQPIPDQGHGAGAAKECSGAPGFNFTRSGESFNGEAKRTEGVSAEFDDCDVDIIPLIFANRSRLIRPEGWPRSPLVHLRQPTRFEVPPSVRLDPSISTLQFGVLVFNPGTAVPHPLKSVFAEEILFP